MGIFFFSFLNWFEYVDFGGNLYEKYFSLPLTENRNVFVW